MRRLVPLTFIVVLGFAGLAFAQQPPSGRSPLRGYLIAGGGTSIGVPQSTFTLSAEVAENVLPSVQVYLGVAFYDNIMSETAQDALEETAEALTETTGTPWAFTGRDLARSVSAGTKFLVPTASPVRPYVGGGVGVINIRRKVVDRYRGAITDAYLQQFGAPDSIVDGAQTNTNRPFAEAAAGVGVAIRRAYVDVGYRYKHAFHTGNDSLNLSQVGVSVGVRF